ncbi:MAG TPA: beta-lactamase family protein [Candidatus Eisenbergiella merdipullorum]|uniref:Beta-lactamase family protein n=1 Tax=Candidatus Eisenbergiella merdipullorum TaxID=2838553 RepID=A0A9D2I6U8_9FIRM|nr:beta-lactamase family protein [Candidatus Eisenbergiella merdipullorum]
MSVTIVSDDEVLFSACYGDCESSDTLFFLGSASKSFTAVCIMQLAKDGKIDLEAPVAAYLPAATDGAGISVSQLLDHTSGLGRYQPLKN